MTDAQQPDPKAEPGTKCKQDRNPTMQPSDKDFEEILEETTALAVYVGRHGNVLGDGKDGEKAYEDLLNALTAARDKPGTATWQGLLKAYASLSAITYKSKGVNGRTILDTRATKTKDSRLWFLDLRYRPVAFGIGLFAVAMILELLAGWSGRISDPTLLTGVDVYAYAFANTLAAFLIPATWGGIGASIFLTKGLSDKLQEMAYEASRVKGDTTRMFLGAMLGVIVVVVFFPEFGDKIQVGDVSFGPATAAFLAGLGVKPVYSAFEALSEGFAQRISGKKERAPQ